jgi:hypothetical protein
VDVINLLRWCGAAGAQACGAGAGVHVPAQRLAELMVEGRQAPEHCPHFSRRIQQVSVRAQPRRSPRQGASTNTITYLPERCPRASGAQVAVQCSDDDGAMAVRALLNALGKTGERPPCSTPQRCVVRERLLNRFGNRHAGRGRDLGARPHAR